MYSKAPHRKTDNIGCSRHHPQIGVTPGIGKLFGENCDDILSGISPRFPDKRLVIYLPAQIVFYSGRTLCLLRSHIFTIGHEIPLRPLSNSSCLLPTLATASWVYTVLIVCLYSSSKIWSAPQACAAVKANRLF